MENTGAHPIEAMPSDGLRQRRQRRHRSTETKTTAVNGRRGHSTERKTIGFQSLLDIRTFKLEVDFSETIAEVKAMIHEQGGPHPMQQRLVFCENQLDDDDRTLADYGVQHGPTKWAYGSSLMVTCRCHPPPKSLSLGEKAILINFFGEIIKLELDLSSATTFDLKDMIYKKMRTTPGQQRFIFNGKQVSDDEHRPLKERGFQYGSMIYLVRRLRGGGQVGSERIEIFVRTLDNKTILFGLLSNTTHVKAVKQRICLDLGVWPAQHHLVFRGQPLDDDKTLADYNIVKDNSIIHLARDPCGGTSDFHEDEDGLVNNAQAPGTYAAAVDEQERQSSGSQSQGVLCHHEGRNKQIMEASSSEIREEPQSMGINDTVPPVDESKKKQMELVHKQKKQLELTRWSKYSVKALLFAITTLFTYMRSTSTLFSTGNMVFKISIGCFFIADVMLSIIKMPPEIVIFLVYLSCFLLVLVTYLLLVSFNKYYGYAILLVPLPIVAAVLQHKFLPGLTQHPRSKNNEGDHFIDVEDPGQAHRAGEEDGQHFERIFELSAEIVTGGGLLTLVFGNSMVGPVSAVGFFSFYTVSLGLYLMMVTTVRTVVLTAHSWYLAILLKVLLVITLITAMSHVVQR